jgi:UDP-N-acetyl-D-mannosaminuronic acid transferase (WecB/TagA/CpsF family)
MISSYVFENSKTIVPVNIRAKRGKYLIFIRCGKNKPNIDFEFLSKVEHIDVILSLYCKPNYNIDIENVSIYSGGLSKYHGFQQVWNTNKSVREYDSYGFFDADINCDSRDVLGLFQAGEKFDLDVWHPSLTANSHSKWDFLYRQNSNLVGFRPSNFVEVMSPFFNQLSLEKCLGSFSESISTWGIDYAWSKILKSSNFGIIDNYSIEHEEKPDLNNGPFYKYLASMGINPKIELWRMRFKYKALWFIPGIEAEFKSKVCRAWVELLNRTDEINPGLDLDSKQLEVNQYVFFLNHHSLLTLCDRGILPEKDTLAYADGALLRYQIKLKGPRMSFDFTGVAARVFKKIADNKIISIFIGGTDSEGNIFKDKISENFPNILIETADGYRDVEGIVSYLDLNNVSENNFNKIVVLGLGTPKQEDALLVLKQQTEKNQKILAFTCGGFISQTASNEGIRYYPRIINFLNLRSVWRILKEPHVLKRVIFNYPRSVYLILKK